MMTKVAGPTATSTDADADTEQEQHNGVHGGVLRVVLVEDEVIVAWDIAETVKRLGYKIVGMADTAEQAVRLVEALVPDVILMDIRLNGALDGIEAARLIRERTGRGVIYLTAHADLATMERAATTEPLGYVFKPFSQEVLRSALLRASGAPEPRRANEPEPKGS
jgi:AmiR/NasT family two-component response regulator